MHKRLFGLLASAAIAFAACTGSATPSPSASSAASTAPATEAPTPPPTSPPLDLSKTNYFDNLTPAAHTGGTLVMAEWQTVAGYNPYYAAANADIEAIAPALEGLLTVGGDLGYIPDMASNVPTVANGGVVVNGAGMDVTWHLKPGMLWSDGQPINCDDVEATRAWIMDKDQAGLYAGTVGVEDITSVDGGTGTDCVMHFKKTYSAYLLLFGGPAGAILPKHYIETIPVKDAPTRLYALNNPKGAVYSGPYIPTDIKPDAQITYAPNPNWKTIGLGADTSKNHAPYLDKLVMQYFGDSPGMIAAYRNGQIDLAMDLSDSDIDSVKDIPDNEKLIQDALFTESNYYNNASFKKKFGDADGPQIIRAIMEATDVDAVIAGPMGGSVTRSCDNIASPLLWFYKEEQCVKTDPADATSKLDALGWTVGTDGVREKNGVKLVVEYCTTLRPYRVDAITLVSSQLKTIGIQANVNAKPAQPDVFGGWNDAAPDTKCNLQHGNFDVAMHGFVSSPDPTAGTLTYSTKGNPDVPPHSGGNEMRISIPAMDAAYDKANTSLDPAEIKAALAAAQDIYGSDQNTFELPFFNHRNLWLVSPKVHNFTGNPSTTTGNWNTGDWWIDQ
jgi:peptide/nickel transport system substrate-binding protein